MKDLKIGDVLIGKNATHSRFDGYCEEVKIAKLVDINQYEDQINYIFKWYSQRTCIGRSRNYLSLKEVIHSNEVDRRLQGFVKTDKDFNKLVSSFIKGLYKIQSDEIR